MAKFFFEKDKKSGAPMQSQVIGIVWISVVLLLIAGLAVFMPKKGGLKVEDSCKMAADTAALTEIEDSVYRSRRTHPGATRHPYRRDDPSPSGTTPRKGESTAAPLGERGRWERQPLTVELNSADTLTLQLLHGIGPAYASRIVRYRERLGGFTSKEQLLEVYGFTPELLAHIGPNITLDTQAIRKMDINSIPLKQLIKHPYIEYYQARDIVSLRSKGVRFSTPEDLRSVPSMADSTLQRLLPYISFD